MPSKKMMNRSLISEMEQLVKRMLKLIEEDADSFAKKAEMYYQTRPELISLVEDFYRMYQSLAERYDHVTGELGKNIPSDLQEMDQHVKQMLELIEEDADSFAKKAEIYYRNRPKLTSLVEDFYRKYRSLAERYDHVTGKLRRNIPSDLPEIGGLEELDLRCQSLEEGMRRVQAEKAEMEVVFRSQIEQLRADIADKNDSVEELKKNLDALQLKYDMLMAEKDNLNINIAALAAKVSSKDDQIDEMSKQMHQFQMHQLNMEHVYLIAGAEGTRKLAEELRSKIEELERKVERKQ
ncbi:hypothetical protein Pfo_006871 [Paulownia fortunei]|nr:hypothetical protein Pfo_006871 [Paulownia fortunei]